MSENVEILAARSRKVPFLLAIFPSGGNLFDSNHNKTPDVPISLTIIYFPATA
jgi:hypothetical protein